MPQPAFQILPARGWRGAAFARVRAGEDTPGANVLALAIDGERAYLVFAIGKNGQQSLHPISVLLKRLDARKRFGLRGKCSIGSAKGFAAAPTLAAFARNKEFLRYVSDRRHRGLLQRATPDRKSLAPALPTFNDGERARRP